LNAIAPPLVSGDLSSAETLALRLGLQRLSPGISLQELPDNQLVLDRDEEGRLCLRRGGARSPGPVFVDFASPAMRYRRRGGQNELVGRAVGVSGVRCPMVLDATAGLGRDAFVLADLGCRVTMCERNPVMQALLEDGLQRARETQDAAMTPVLDRLALLPGDARDSSAAALSAVQTIYLDPMFPARGKSAAVKKDLASLQLLLDEPVPEEGGQLLDWALRQVVNRVVVKRSPRAASLAGPAPSHQLTGKSVRYDVYMLNRKSLS
jgi:16S rRNA (guanine1516-N2)-methyltransferase